MDFGYRIFYMYIIYCNILNKRADQPWNMNVQWLLTYVCMHCIVLYVLYCRYDVISLTYIRYDHLRTDFCKYELYLSTHIRQPTCDDMVWSFILKYNIIALLRTSLVLTCMHSIYYMFVVRGFRLTDGLEQKAGEWKESQLRTHIKSTV